MLMIFGKFAVFICLLPAPVFPQQDQCDRCVCPRQRAKPIPRSENRIYWLNSEERAEALSPVEKATSKLDQEATNRINYLNSQENDAVPSRSRFSADTMNRRTLYEINQRRKIFKESKQSVEDKMKGLALKPEEKTAVLSILENAQNQYDKKSNRGLTNRILSGVWKTVYNTLVPVRKMLINNIFPLHDGCTFQNAIKCSLTIGDIVLGCTIQFDYQILQIIYCSHAKAARKQCGDCVCTVTAYFLNKIKSTTVGQLPFCKDYIRP